jgi:predicted lipoprotein with Yx(FWY)xxD motif
MLDQSQQQTAQAKSHRRPARVGICAVAVLAVAASFAAVAFASGTVTVSSATNAKLGTQVVVNAQGKTLYALSPETSKHLLCKSTECLKFWPPLTVPSSKTKLKAGPGVKGHLAILHRKGGLLQVTLRGMPLYRFAKDHGKDESNGEGVESFEGTWHAVTAASAPGASTPSTPTMPSAPTTPAEPPYGY